MILLEKIYPEKTVKNPNSNYIFLQYIMDNLGNDELEMKTALNEKGERLPCLQRCTFQTEKVSVTSSRYPSENTFVRRKDIW